MDICVLGCEGENGADFLAIDDLLDFSNDDIGGPIDSPCITSATSQSSAPSNDISNASSQASSTKEKNSALQPSGVFDSDELCVPCDDLAELEWLSNFVEESFSSGDHATASLCFASDGKPTTTEESKAHRECSKPPFQSTSPVSVLESSVHSREKPLTFNCGPDMSVPARARTKRGRTAVCFWNTQILSAEASESILESSSTASTITSDSDMINTSFYDHDDDDYDENEDNDDDDDNDDFDVARIRHHHQHRRPASKGAAAYMKVKKFNKVMASFYNNKPKKMKVDQEIGQQQVARKCLHCATTKTPQWRAGPMGPKTLCNACGVRFKSGRLCAEYRPAASPTFIENVHSNSHRKVIEMRRQRGETRLNPSSVCDLKSPTRLGHGI